MKKQILYSSCLLLFFTMLSLYKTTYAEIISPEDSHFTARPFLTRESFQFDLKSGDKKLSYSPNIQWKIGAQASYDAFALYLITNTPGSSMRPDTDTHGKSKSFDAIIHWYTRVIGVDLFYQWNKGFYLDKQDPSGASGQRYLFRNIRTHTFGINGYYIFSGDKFSLSASLDQSEIQTHSAGSFIIMAFAHYLDLNNSESIIPSGFSTDFRDIEGFKGGNFATAGLGPGYAYNFVFSRFYISPAFFAGIGAQYRKYTLSDGEKQNGHVALKINWRLGAGYNGDNFIAGARFIVDYTQVPLEDYTFNLYTLEGTVFAGIRF